MKRNRALDLAYYSLVLLNFFVLLGLILKKIPVSQFVGTYPVQTVFFIAQFIIAYSLLLYGTEKGGDYFNLNLGFTTVVIAIVASILLGIYGYITGQKGWALVAMLVAFFWMLPVGRLNKKMNSDPLGLFSDKKRDS